MREKLIELFYDNNVRCDQKIEVLAEDVMDIVTHGVTVQEWISANEPPKENCKRVLIALRWGDTDIGWYDKEDKCWRSEYVNCYDVGKVTHWQPMPQPPKGE